MSQKKYYAKYNMPPIKTRRFNRTRRRKPNLFGVKPSFMSKSVRRKRDNAVNTRVFYFKTAGQIASTADGRYSETWSPMRWLGLPPAAVDAVPNFAQLGDFQEFSKAYTQYKILCFKINIFAANVGSERQPTAASTASGYLRGDCILYPINNRAANTAVSPDILTLITRAGAKMIPARASKWSRTLYRPKGFPTWGNCDSSIPNWQNRVPDPWHGNLILQGQNASFSPASTRDNVYFYYTMTTKVAFRGRRLIV